MNYIKFSAILFSCFFNLLSAYTQNITRPNVLAFGDIEVNTFTGNLLQQRSEFLIPGQGIDVEIAFSYNVNAKNKNTGYGNGWSFSYGMHYKQGDNSDIILERPDGRIDTFKLENGAYLSPKGIFDFWEEYQSNQFRLVTKHGMIYYFDNSNHKCLTSIEDRNGNSLQFTYTGNKLTTITDASSRTLTLTWQGEFLSSITNNNTNPIRQYKYAYDDENNLISVENPIGDKQFYNYSLDKDLVSYIDEKGVETLIVYSEVGAVTRISSCIGEMRFSFVAASRETFVTLRANDVDQLTTYQFDTTGNLLQQRGNCCGFNTTYEYDKDKNISKVIDANGSAYTFTYDDKGNLLSETDPLGNSVAYTYHTEFSFVETITDKRGNQTTFTYDSDGNLTQLQKPAGITELFTYDANGNLISSTDGTGNVTTLTYDNNGQVTQATYPIGTETISYDNVGNISVYTDANQNSVSFTYDALDRIVTATDDLGNGQTYAYDPLGNITTLTDANNHTQEHSYDFLNRLTQVQIPVATYNYDYDQAGNLTAVKDGNNHSCQYQYDDRNLLIAETDAEGKVTHYEYDGNGNLNLRTDANGKTTQYNYDALNRLVNKSYEGNTDTYTYDENGNMTQSANDNITINYGYDAANRLISKTMVEWNKTINYTYDAADNRTSMTDPDGGVTNYTYDKLNRLTQLLNPSGQITGFLYDDANRLTRQNNGNGTYTLYTYDDADRVLSIFHHRSNASIISGFTYTYDNKGNRLTTNEHGVGVHTYTYDDSDRLLSVNYPDGQTESFTYDAAGNRTQSVRNDVTITYTYDRADRLITAGNATYAFDDNGNMAQKEDVEGTTIYQYDGEDRLVSVGLLNEDVVTFSYDPFGNRLVSNFDGLDTKYVLDGLNTLVELNNGNTTQTRYTALFDYDSWINMEKNGSSFQYHSDAIGSVRNLTNQSGVLENQYSYFAFGDKKNETELTLNKIRYSGRIILYNSNIYDYRSRIYNPSIARFLTKDLFPGLDYSPLSINKYSYVENNPLKYTDPTGELAFLPAIPPVLKALGAIGAGVIGGGVAETGLQYTSNRISGANHSQAVACIDYYDVAVTAGISGAGVGAIGTGFSAYKNYRRYKFFKERNGIKAVTNHYRGKMNTSINHGVGGGLLGLGLKRGLNGQLNNEYECEDDDDEDDNGSQEGMQPNSNGEASCTVGVGSFDPNEIHGPAGFGDKRWLPQNGTMPYNILYENDPEFATAPAQIVTIIQDIDPQLDPKSFRIGSFGFGFFEFEVPADISHYQTRIESTVDSLDVMVDVDIGVDFEKNQLYWKFTSIDPATGFLTNDPFGGFLPVNDDVKRGEGFANYTISPHPDAQTNDEITAQASNIFDFNDPVLTNIETNTIDATPPTSEVHPITSAPNAENLLVTWGGSDAGAGINNYNIYVSINGGTYTKWLENTAQTSSVFPAKLGDSYCFISLATDNVGNIQALPTTCETPVTFTEELLENCSNTSDLAIDYQPIPSGVYRSPQRISSNGTITNSESVAFLASESITLKSGFVVESGATFLAAIEDCTNAIQSIPNPSTYRLSSSEEQINFKSKDLQLKCVPNPISQTATIFYEIPEVTEAALILFDGFGQQIQVLSDKKIHSAGQHNIQIQTTLLESGMYFAVLRTTTSKAVTKIVVIK